MATSVATRYRVRAGDTLSEIAERFGTSVKALARANHIININLIRIGQVLVIPRPGAVLAGPTPLRYVVRVGDTLSAIAARFGTTVKAIARANHITNPNLIRAGQVLQIVGSAIKPPALVSVAVPTLPKPKPKPHPAPHPAPPPPGKAGDLTKAQLLAIMPLAKRVADAYLPHLNFAMREASITTPLRRAAFLAQLAHESLQLKFMEEIASGAAYEGRVDLGNTHPGDGRRFKGRGPIQLTGRNNYRDAGRALGIDLLANPKRAADPDVGFRVAGWFWTTRGLNALADKRDFDRITRRINGGLNGKADRDRYYAVARRVLRAG